LIDFVLKHLLSLMITVVTLYVPQDEWQKKLDALPTQEERIARKKLMPGWETGSVISSRTGLKHIFYRYPSADTASKRILLLLHGFNTDGSIFFNLSPLADTRTLVAYNFPEQTDIFTGGMRDFEMIIDDFCEAMHFDTVDMLGNSLGGIIATFYTAQTGHVAIRSLVLASTYVHGATKENVRQVRKMADKLLPFPDYKLFYLLSFGSKVFDRADRKNKEGESPLETVVIKRIGWYREILTMLYWYDGTGDAARIECPVLVLHGDADRLVPLKETEATRQFIPQAKVKVFDKAGHTLIFSQAQECMEEMRKEKLYTN
jgi:pimeloyl-ACP methyl ester carboxylesterase